MGRWGIGKTRLAVACLRVEEEAVRTWSGRAQWRAVTRAQCCARADAKRLRKKTKVRGLARMRDERLSLLVYLRPRFQPPASSDLGLGNRWRAGPRSHMNAEPEACSSRCGSVCTESPAERRNTKAAYS